MDHAILLGTAQITKAQEIMIPLSMAKVDRSIQAHRTIVNFKISERVAMLQILARLQVLLRAAR